MIEELKAFSPFYGTRRQLFGDEAIIAARLTAAIEDHLVLVAHRGDERMGFIVGVVAPHMYNPDITVLCAFLWWVSPQYRCTGAGSALLDTFTAWGKVNADWVILPIGKNCPIKEQSLERRGFALQDKSYLLEVN